MAITLQDVLDRARIPLNDAAKVRYPDADLLAYANAGIRVAMSLRPDLRFGKFGAPYTDLPLADDFPMDARYVQPIADYVTGRAETRDDEHINSGRAAQFIAAFEQQLSSL